MAMTGKDWFRMAFDPAGQILEKNNLNPHQLIGGPSPAEATGMPMLTGGKQLEEDMKPPANPIFIDTNAANATAQQNAGGQDPGGFGGSGMASSTGWSPQSMQPYLAEALRGPGYS